MQVANTFHKLEKLGSHDSVLVRRLTESFCFTYKQLLACIFPIYIIAMLAVLKVFPIPFARYDVMLFACLAMQAMLFITKVESAKELRVISIFHVLGLTMELFKTHMGSWSYPDDAFTKIATVPLYSGFMYASVASYLVSAWRLFDVRLNNMPSRYIVMPLGIMIYLNFFSLHFIPDLRWGLYLLVLLVFARTSVSYTANLIERRMPLHLVFFLVGFFVWVAENIVTYLNAWSYPYQHEAWQMVDWAKIGSWSLLIIVSFLIVAEIKRTKNS